MSEIDLKCRECGQTYPEEDRCLRARAAELKAVIRRQTVDAPDDEPNGPTEERLERMFDELKKCSLSVAAKEAVSLFVEGVADDNAALRRAAEAYFGENFSRPTK